MADTRPDAENVMNHGALADGSDDTAAIQAAVDAAGAGDGAGSVYFPPGLFTAGLSPGFSGGLKRG